MTIYDEHQDPFSLVKEIAALYRDQEPLTPDDAEYSWAPDDPPLHHTDPYQDAEVLDNLIQTARAILGITNGHPGPASSIIANPQWVQTGTRGPGGIPITAPTGNLPYQEHCEENVSDDPYEYESCQELMPCPKHGPAAQERAEDFLLHTMATQGTDLAAARAYLKTEEDVEARREAHPEEFCQAEVPDENNIGEPCGNPLPCPDHGYGVPPLADRQQELVDALNRVAEGLSAQPETKAHEPFAYLKKGYLSGIKE